jgi:Asp-tRNA(Asn)/Glu-tRNA(Gln) amidotransferase A subunit family amidase
VVEEVKPPVDYQQLRGSFVNLFTTIVAFLFKSKELELGRALTVDEIGVANFLTLEQGRKLDAASHLEAEMMIGMVTAQMDAFFNSHDILLTPTVGTPPVDVAAVTPSTPPDGVSKIVDTYGTFTVAGSYAGIPGISLPLYWTKEGLPVGTLFQARFGNDALLLRLASQLEQARPWIQRYPKLG